MGPGLRHCVFNDGNLARIGGLIKGDLINPGLRRIEQNLKISPDTGKVLSAIGNVVFNSLKMTLEAMESLNASKISKVIDVKEEVEELVAQAESHQAARLIADGEYGVRLAYLYKRGQACVFV